MSTPQEDFQNALRLFVYERSQGLNLREVIDAHIYSLVSLTRSAQVSAYEVVNRYMYVHDATEPPGPTITNDGGTIVVGDMTITMGEYQGPPYDGRKA